MFQHLSCFFTALLCSIEQPFHSPEKEQPAVCVRIRIQSHAWACTWRSDGGNKNRKLTSLLRKILYLSHRRHNYFHIPSCTNLHVKLKNVKKILRMEAESRSETLVSTHQSTRCHIPEDWNSPALMRVPQILWQTNCLRSQYNYNACPTWSSTTTESRFQCSYWRLKASVITKRYLVCKKHKRHKI